MKTKFVSAAKNFHAMAMRAADNLAEGKRAEVSLDWRQYDVDIFRVQVRLYLAHKYGFSANNSEDMVNKNLTCLQAENSL